MIFVDTNVISESLKKTPDPAVLAWLVRNDAELALPTVTIAEVAFGIQKIRPDERADRLEQGLSRWRHRFADRIFGLTEEAALAYGEIMGAAIEGAMYVEVFVELLKREATPVPRIENADEVMFVGSGRPLEDAARVAFKAMVHWVSDRRAMSELDAYQFVSQLARAPIIQLVDPEYTVLVKLAKARLPR